MPAASSNSDVTSSARPSVRATAPLRAAMLLSALYFLARFTRLLQSTLIFSLLPRGASDAYVAAFTLPDYLNYLVASGTLSLTFIPIFTDFWQKGKEAQAWRFFSALATTMGVVLTLLTVVLLVFARPIVIFANSGFDDPAKAHTLDLAVAMTRILLPAQLFFYLGGLMIGVLNGFKRFGAAGWTGALYNVVAVLFAVPLFVLTKNPLLFAWGITLGAFVGNFLLPLIALQRGPRAQRPRFRPLFNFGLSSVRRYFVLTIPIMVSVSIATADVWVVKYFASQMPTGAMTNVNAAYRLMIAAQGTIGQAAAVAAFPFLASAAAKRENEEFSSFLRTGLRRLMFVTLPVSTLLILDAAPLCRLIYGYGHFNDAGALNQTARCFALFCVGIFAWAGQGLVARGFYALGDTKTPNIVGSLVTVVLFIPLCAWLKRVDGVAGLALATSLAIAFYFAVLLVLLNRKIAQRSTDFPLGLERIGGTLVRTFVACFLMGVAGLLALLLARPLAGNGKIEQLALLGWTSVVAIFVFVSAAGHFEIPEWLWLRDKFRRKRSQMA